MGDVDDSTRAKRVKVRAVGKRDSYVAHIKAIHATAQQANDDAAMAISQL